MMCMKGMIKRPVMNCTQASNATQGLQYASRGCPKPLLNAKPPLDARCVKICGKPRLNARCVKICMGREVGQEARVALLQPRSVQSGEDDINVLRGLRSGQNQAQLRVALCREKVTRGWTHRHHWQGHRAALVAQTAGLPGMCIGKTQQDDLKGSVYDRLALYFHICISFPRVSDIEEPL